MSATSSKVSDLKDGDRIQFFAVPYGSYASVLTVYRVEVMKDSIRVINERNGSSTWDKKYAYRGASFEIIA